MTKKFLLIVAAFSLNAGLFADDEVADVQTETSEVAANETAAVEAHVEEAAPQKGCGCPHAK